MLTRYPKGDVQEAVKHSGLTLRRGDKLEIKM